MGALRFMRGAGCDACGGTGYRGRIGVFEMLDVDDTIRRIPILGTLLRQAALATSARLFAILYSSGTVVPSAVTLAAHTVGNHVLRH